MRLIHCILMCAPIFAWANPQVAYLSCEAEVESHHISLTVSNSPMGDGGLYLTIDNAEYPIIQAGYDKNVAGNVIWGGNHLPGRWATMSQTNRQFQIELKTVPISVKYDFLGTSDNEFQHSFETKLTLITKDLSLTEINAICTYQNIPSTND